ncbi:50S ribosomal protein L3 N(5)-glutamine methyltransferase [Motiliproteus sp. MSK22-1]|uniref:50S ribosomal protein L3 N(5)-glutamine methyltransferase n=1 Tax=Motiliproteus sp. MSK22-1 TaxID=1897630 RepID=UPI000977E8BB|nr:50S ribosomal protein L3 N(5)-glutamine methyltransferase [Motiliproteus sp. MSK22-1]OMH38716.1 ribosomal protein L3 N(5)-glutamine methyltransferase [Motiliproteus sp. MSK22-1]
MDQNDTALKQLKTIRDFIRLGASRMNKADLFFGHGTDNSWDEAVQMVLHVAGMPWNADPEVLSARLLESEKREVLRLFDARIKQRIPAPYLIGEAYFCGMPFFVDQRVLIPRSPIAGLIEEGFQPWLGDVAVERVLDLCTGSGCIGIACAQYFEMAEVDLVDLSADALEVCQKNINQYQLQERVQAIQSDLFTEVNQRYQLIVSNPPYVNRDDLASMPKEYQHEPALGLGSGVDGLDITRQILRQASEYLTEDGVLVVEVGNSEVALQQQYPEVPFIWLDLPNGGNGVFLLSAETLQQHQSCF